MSAVVIVGGGETAAAAARAAEAAGARVVVVDAVVRLMRPGDALRGVVTADGATLEAGAVILTGADAVPAARAIGGDGLRTDAQGRVLDVAELPIPGLYAAADEAAGERAGTHAAARVTARNRD